MLANRLARLVEHGIVVRAPYQEPGARVRSEYKVTEMGFELYPVLAAVKDWGDRYLADPDGPPLRLEHRDCGGEVHAALVCEGGHPVDRLRDVVPRRGPGARRRT